MELHKRFTDSEKNICILDINKHKDMESLSCKPPMKEGIYVSIEKAGNTEPIRLCEMLVFGYSIKGKLKLDRSDGMLTELKCLLIFRLSFGQ